MEMCCTPFFDMQMSCYGFCSTFSEQRRFIYMLPTYTYEASASAEVAPCLAGLRVLAVRAADEEIAVCRL